MDQPLNDGVHGGQLLAMLFLFSFKLFHLTRQVLVGSQHFPELHKGTDDENVHLNSTLAIEN